MRGRTAIDTLGRKFYIEMEIKHTDVKKKEHDRGTESINLAVLRFPSRCSATKAQLLLDHLLALSCVRL